MASLRYYNPSTGRFVSEDPIGFKGQDINLYRYVNNEPLGFIDPIGLLSFRANLERRRKLNDNYISMGIKTATSVIIATAFNSAARKQVGLGIGLGELLKNRFLISTLGTKTGTIGAFFLSTGFKSVLVGSFYTAGQEIGNRLGAYLDTIVDDAQGVGKKSILEDLFFGSGLPNKIDGLNEASTENSCRVR